MKTLFKNAMVFTNNKFIKCDVEITDYLITKIASNIIDEDIDVSYNLSGLYLLPGLIDVHTHLREPGFAYKETIATGTLAAAKGGYTSICAMPNLKPTPDCMKNLEVELQAIRNTAKINVYPYGTITKGEKGEELAEFSEMKNYVVGYSDDGKGIQSESMMFPAMQKAKRLDKKIVSHCEDNTLLNEGYIHDGKYAKLHGHKGICSESEWKAIERDLKLALKTGCSYHVCHVSTKESVNLIRKAEKEGINVTCETAPHYLVLNDMDLQEDGRFKMNPPIRSIEDQNALIRGLRDGTIDIIATDHAPHSLEEKSKGLKGSSMGVVGLEVAFPILYTYLVSEDFITLEKLLELMNTNPRKIFGIGTEIKVGERADLTIYDLNEEYDIDSSTFLSKGKSTPFDGMHVFGKCKMTLCDGEIVYKD